MISFQAKTKDFKKTLSQLRKTKKGQWLIHNRDTCEITLIDGEVILAVPGAIFKFKCITKGTAKCTVPFKNLFHIIEHHRLEDIYVEFLDDEIILGYVRVKAQTTFFRTDKILKTIQLPHNYNDLDLIRLKTEGYTEEELDFNNLSHLIEQAERRVFYRIRCAAKYLRDYGIMPKEIKKFVMGRLSINLDLDEKDLKVLLEEG